MDINAIYVEVTCVHRQDGLGSENINRVTGFASARTARAAWMRPKCLRSSCGPPT